MVDVEEELAFRGVPVEELPKKITERKVWLQEMEHLRLVEEESMDAKEARVQADKHFKKLSNAPFNFSDEQSSKCVDFLLLLIVDVQLHPYLSFRGTTDTLSND